MTLKKNQHFTVRFWGGGGGKWKEYSLYAFINVDDCEQPLIRWANVRWANVLWAKVLRPWLLAATSTMFYSARNCRQFQHGEDYDTGFVGHVRTVATSAKSRHQLWCRSFVMRIIRTHETNDCCTQKVNKLLTASENNQEWVTSQEPICPIKYMQLVKGYHCQYDTYQQGHICQGLSLPIWHLSTVTHLSCPLYIRPGAVIKILIKWKTTISCSTFINY